MNRMPAAGFARCLCWLAIAALSACSGRIHREGVAEADKVELGQRFVVKARDAEQAAALDQALRSRFGAGAEARAMFESVDPATDTEGMTRMLRVSVPQRALPNEQPWENAYWLESELGLEVVEPDLENTLAATTELAGSCEVDVAPPPNKRWSLEAIRATQAWTLSPPAGGRQFGEGISVCHPDTGWTQHIDLDADRLDLSRARNLLGNGTPDGSDPMVDQGPLLHPGHGTGTGSVIVSGHAQGEVHGVAPRARLVPIRTAKSVVQVFDSDLARAVNYSVDAGCDVISMSLGGRAFFGLEAAIRRAVRANVIVAAAAGNCVGFVVAPAAYDDTLAIAGANISDRPWKGSSRGPAVDVSAPAEHVWIARRRKPSDPTTTVDAGQGTSYAVANAAGAAALWLGFHGRSALLARYQGAARLQDVFRLQLARSARVPTGWATQRFGAGILDTAALLRAPLPTAMEVANAVPEAGATPALNVVSAVIGRPPREAAPLLARLFGVTILELEDRLREWGPELIQLALAKPAEFRAMLDALEGVESGGGAEPGAVATAASTALRAQLTLPASSPGAGGDEP